MRSFRSILWQRIAARAGPLRVDSLAVHRHLPEITTLGTHRHRFWQALLYLSGRGIQEIEGLPHPVGTGSLALLPPGRPHAFRRTGSQAALCLVIEFTDPDLAGRPAVVRRLTALELGEVRRSLARIARLGDADDPAALLGRAGLALTLLENLFRATGWFPASPAGPPSALPAGVRRLLESPEADRQDLRALAVRAGQNADTLSRTLRRTTGLTLGQWRNRYRLQRAQAALREKRTIGEAAAAAGFDDQNYFARWFRSQTGVSASAWRRRERSTGQ